MEWNTNTRESDNVIVQAPEATSVGAGFPPNPFMDWWTQFGQPAPQIVAPLDPNRMLELLTGRVMTPDVGRFANPNIWQPPLSMQNQNPWESQVKIEKKK